jgi:hypothetical protein
LWFERGFVTHYKVKATAAQGWGAIKTFSGAFATNIHRVKVSRKGGAHEVFLAKAPRRSAKTAKQR